MALTQSITDDFSNPATKATKWPNSYGGATIANGVATVTADGANANTEYSGFNTANLDLTGSYVFAKMTPTTINNVNANSYVAFGNGGNQYWMGYINGQMKFARQTSYNDVANNTATFAWTGGTPIWVGLAEGAGCAYFGQSGVAAGTVRFYRSNDGVTWTQVTTSASIAKQTFATAAKILLGTDYGGMAAGTSCTTVFDNVNVAGATGPLALTGSQGLSGDGTLTVTEVPTTAPAAPAAPTVTPSYNSASISWATVPKATSYDVEYAPVVQNNGEVLTSSQGTLSLTGVAGQKSSTTSAGDGSLAVKGTPNVSTSAGGTTNAPKLTVPSGVKVGDVLLLHLVLNNTDVVTAEPAGFTQIGTPVSTSGATQFADRMYWGVVDGAAIAAGTLVQFTLSATRVWTLGVQAFSGVNRQAPVLAQAQTNTTASGAVHNSPPITTTDQAFIIQVAGFKAASATPIASIQPPAGYSTVTQTIMSGGFNLASSMAIRDVAPAATYGGDAWTVDTNTAPEAIRTIALAVAPVSQQVDSTGSGTLTVQSTPGARASVALSGVGTQTLTSKPATTASLATTGDGTLGVRASALSATTRSDGSGTLGVSGYVPGGTITTSGDGSLAVTGKALAVGVALSGSGTLGVTAIKRVAVTLALSGDSSLGLLSKPQMSTDLDLQSAGELTLASAVTVELGGDGAFGTRVPMDITVTAKLKGTLWSGTLTQQWKGSLS